MARRFEIKDSHHPQWRGQRFATLAGAEREYAHAVPKSRFYILDRETGTVVVGDADDS